MNPFGQLAIPQNILDKLFENARAELPNECCGLLAGRIEAGVGQVTMRLPIRNDAPSPREYRTNARDLLDAFRTIREAGLELLAIYHSHPVGEPVPSHRDLAENTYGQSVVHLILGMGTHGPKIRGWWLTDTEYKEAELVSGLTVPD